MSASMGRIGVIIGMILLIHTGYSASQYRSFLRYNEEEFTSLPLDMVLEGLIGMALAVWGVSSTKTFKEIRAVDNLAQKSCESFLNRSNFMTFDHRGKRLFGVE